MAFAQRERWRYEYQKGPAKILGTSVDATDAEIKSAYRQLARKYHPDVNRNPGAAEMFNRVTDAYETIANLRGFGKSCPRKICNEPQHEPDTEPPIVKTKAQLEFDRLASEKKWQGIATIANGLDESSKGYALALLEKDVFEVLYSMPGRTVIQFLWQNTESAETMRVIMGMFIERMKAERAGADPGTRLEWPEKIMEMARYTASRGKWDLVAGLADKITPKEGELFTYSLSILEQDAGSVAASGNKDAMRRQSTFLKPFPANP